MELDPHMYDSTRWQLIPAGTKSIAIYGNGDFAADREEVQEAFPDARIWDIDVIGNDYTCGILDVEIGDATPGDIKPWALGRLEMHGPTILNRIYCDRGNWNACKYAVAGLAPAVRASIRWWIADWTNVEHLLPGSDATQWINTTNWDQSYINIHRFG